MTRTLPLVALLTAFTGLIFAGPAAAQPGVVARVSLSTQRMEVYVDGQPRYNWPVSTARRGYRTPTGTFQPTALTVWHRSTIYSGSPMPYSIFFLRGYAIHGSYEIKHLGSPGEPRLRETASVQCQGAVFAGQRLWTRQHDDTNHALEHDAEKWHPVFRTDHAQTSPAYSQSLCGGAPRSLSPNQLSAAPTLLRAA